MRRDAIASLCSPSCARRENAAPLTHRAAGLPALRARALREGRWLPAGGGAGDEDRAS